MIVRAATALEMIHAYILIIDDIQDQSKVRRGKPTVHEDLAAYHKEHQLRGDSYHAGISLALNAALAGAHSAQALLAGLTVSDELRIKALGIINYTMVITAHGQTTDITNEIAPNVSTHDIENTLEWKTAHYTVLNPLCVGMVLAGAGCKDTDAIRDYALHTGKAFQITDDIIGTFGDDTQTGKSSMDDMREGKRTLLTEYAFDHAEPADINVLKRCLGNKSLSQKDFVVCRRIIRESGSLDNAQAVAQVHTDQALHALTDQGREWNMDTTTFLRGFARSLAKRAA